MGTDRWLAPSDLENSGELCPSAPGASHSRAKIKPQPFQHSEEYVALRDRNLVQSGRYIESGLLAGHLRFLECRSRNITRRYLTNTNLDDLHRRDHFELQATTLDRYDFIEVVYQDFVYSFDDSLAFEEVEKSDSR